jgi:hypothetical protein
MRTHTTHTRDAALGKLRRINGWIIAGSVALTAVLSDVAANAFPGKTIKASSSKSRSSVKHPSTTSTAPAKPLAPPAQAPEAPAQETRESPSQESAPSPEAQQATPAPEAQQSETQTAPPEAPREEAAPESSPPVVSGGS